MRDSDKMEGVEEVPNEDVYVSQLREVFDSCDGTESGYLSRFELNSLCSKLHLEDQAPTLVEQLLGGDHEARVGFDEFKKGFVTVLSETMGGVGSSGDDNMEELEHEEMDNKPSLEVTETDRDVSNTEYIQLEFDIDHGVAGNRSLVTPLSLVAGSVSQGSDTDDYEADTSLLEPYSAADTLHLYDDLSLSEYTPHHAKSTDMFEDKGQMNLTVSNGEAGMDGEKEHLRQIWEELGVGQNGFLTVQELAAVCHHIGMEDMDDEELQQLFDKLDVDGNGRVSFQEFLRGLFLHGSTPPPASSPSVSTPSRLTSTPRHNSKIRNIPSSANLDDSRVTPSYFLSSGYELFTALDIDNTGLSSAESILELWESLGVLHGVDIMQYLQFDLTGKIGLSELSGALRQELHSVEEDNAVYQAALASYEFEIKHLKSFIAHLTSELGKQKSDLTEAGSRIGMLVHEADERQAALEKEREKEIMSVEKRYQDQIRMLQSQLESERRSLLAQSTNQQQVLETQLERSQGEESQLKEHLTLAQKDSKRMESELAEMVERCQELETRTLHQQQELNSAATLQVKLEELEAQRDSWLLTEQETSLQRLCQLQEENKHLKDSNDELATEVRELQSQRLKHRSPESANYKGSLVSEYTIHDTKNKTLHLKSDHQELKVIDNHHQLCDGQEFTSEALNGDYDSLKEQHQAELHAIERGMSLERHDIEESFRLEISDLEEKLVEERKHLCQRFEKEKRELELEANKALTAALIGQEEELQSRFAEEKRDMLIKNMSEKNHLHLQWEEETEKLKARLQTEHQQQLQRELTEQKEEFDKQLEQTVTTDRSSYNSLQQARVEAKLRQQKEELEALFAEERETLETSFRLEQAAKEEQHQLQVASYENIFVKGTEGLHGQLQRDFWSLVDKHRSQVAEQERLRTKDEAAWEREDLIMRMQDERNLLLRQHEDEIRRLSQQHLQEMDDLRETMTQEVEESKLKMTAYQQEVAAAEDRGRREVDALHISFSRERSSWERQREIMKETAEDDAMSSIQGQLQDEFIDQIGKIKVSFDEERCELESTIRLLRRELEVASESQDNQVALETRHRQQLDDLQKVILRLRDEKDEMQAKNKQLETRIDQLQQKYLESTAMSAMNKLPKFTNNLDKEAILQAIESQQKLMEDKTAELKTQIELLQKSSQLPDTTQLEYEDALKNNETLLASLQAAEEKLVSNDSSDQRRTREAQLEKQLEASTNKLTEAKVALAVNNSRLLRDIQTEREKNSLRVDSKEVDVYNSKLVEAEQKIGDLEEALETKAEETTKLLIESHTKSKKCVQNLEREKDQVAWQLKDTHEQLKQQLEKAAKTGLLVKDLYVENANLIHSLQLTEQRQKEAEKRVNQAEDKFLALKEVLKKIYPVVVR